MKTDKAYSDMWDGYSRRAEDAMDDARAQSTCKKHGLEAHYTRNRCIKCMDETPLSELGAPDFTNQKNINL